MLSQYLIVIGLIVLSGLFSGLTLGMFSLNPDDLETKAELGDKRAAAIYPVRKNTRLLLCTLLLGNTAVNASLSIYLGTVAPGLIAGLIATGAIVLLGEILPQALFNRYALKLGYYFIWYIKLFTIVLFPVAKPLAMLLDKIFGDEGREVISKTELGHIVKKQENTPESPIDADEERIILGALSFSDKAAADIATPATVTYCLNQEYLLDNNLLDEIRRNGFSRIPVYEENPDNMVGMLYAKDLLNLIGDEKNYSVGEMSRSTKIFKVEETTKLDSLFNEMIKQKIHLALLYDEFGCFAGIITLEDIIEEILAVEIVDEQDRVTDMQKFARSKSRLRNISE